ncbi:MAG TPA: fibronectin type III domain-containing protein [Nitrosopumilaceae archaeon]|nr:fibronectin type III domain-containing protein [Nitrosopumilaceae archaeon]
MKLRSVFPLNFIFTSNDKARKNPKTIMKKNYHFSKTSIVFTTIAIILVWYTSMPIIAHADSLVATIPVGSKPYTNAYGNGNIYVTNYFGNSVSRINGATNTVVATIPVGNNPIGVAFDSANGNTYVANFMGNTVSVINGTNFVINTIPVGVNPFGVAFDSANGNIYVTNYSGNSVSVINGATNTVVNTIPAGFNPNGIAFDSANGNIYVTNYGANSVSVINGATNTVVNTIPVGISPYGIAYGISNIYVANFGSNTVSVINGTTNTAVNTIPVGINPSWVAFDTINVNVNVVNYGSDTVSVIKPTLTAPAAPAGLTATAISQTQINLSWTASNTGGSPITGYKVEVKVGTLGTYSVLAANTANATTSYSHTALIPSTAYTYRVSAINAIGTSTPSAEASATTPAIVTVPTLTVKSATSGGLVKFTTSAGGFTSLTAIPPSSLSPPPPPGSYPLGFFAWSITGFAPATSVTVTITYPNAVPPGSQYLKLVGGSWVSMPIINSGNTTTMTITDNGPYDSDPTVGVIADPGGLLYPKPPATVPAAPAGLTASAVNATRINLSWTAPSNGGSPITGYKIEYKVGLGIYSTLTTISGNATTSYSHTALIPSTAYTYRVSAINAIGTSTPSAEASATTPALVTVPAAPAGLTATAVSPTQINLAWSAPSNGGSPITGYKVEVKVGTLGTYSVLAANTAGTTTTYSHTGLTVITAYTYRVSAINAIGTSTPSAEASTTLTKVFDDLVLQVGNFHLSAGHTNTLKGEVDSAENSLKAGDIINEQIQMGSFENSVRGICCDNPPFKPLSAADQNILITNAENIIHNSKP